MSSRITAPLAAWTAVSLPLLLVVAACLIFLGNEQSVAAFFSQWRTAHPAATQAVQLYTDWGNPALYLIYAGMLYLGLKRGRADLTAQALAYLAAQLLFSLAIERVLKIGIGRPRPSIGGPFVSWSLDDAHNAMPSGHTTEMTVQTATLALCVRGLAWPLVLGLALALMGASRMALGAHHPTDLLGGWVLGSLGSLFAYKLAPRITPLLSSFFDSKGCH